MQLAARTIPLFRLDRDWTTQNLLPLFDWRRSETEAAVVWRSFLCSARLDDSLMQVLKSAFLETANHYTQLGEYKPQYASLLTFTCLDPKGIFTPSELAQAMRSLPQDGLDEAGRVLVSLIKGSGEQRVEFWRNRCAPFLLKIWPQEQTNASPSVVKSFAHLCVAARGAFPDAFEQVRYWLKPLDGLMDLLRQLQESGICDQFTEQALDFLNLVIDDQTQNPPPDSELFECLKAISESQPRLASDQRYLRLLGYWRLHWS